MSLVKARNVRIVLVTCPTLAMARRITRAVVQKRLAACVNLIRGPVESCYTWRGKLESAREHLLIMKTTTKRLSVLQREVKRFHSYDVPEFLVLPVVAGSEQYLDWLNEATATG